MILESSVNPYLSGDKFDNGLRIKIAEKQKLFSRIDYLTEYSRNKKIIHVGCADHIPIILEKVQNDTWLYKRIDKIASRQVGIDISSEAVSYIKEKLGISNILCMDIIKDEVPEAISSGTWDSMIMGELLEHIDNPVEFLTAINKKYAGFTKELVLTVPNALSLTNFYQAGSKNSERINTDHRYWFTPYTLNKILLRAGFTPLYHEFASYYPLNKKKIVRNFLLKQLLERRPALRSNLIMVAAFS